MIKKIFFILLINILLFFDVIALAPKTSIQHFDNISQLIQIEKNFLKLFNVFKVKISEIENIPLIASENDFDDFLQKILLQTKSIIKTEEEKEFYGKIIENQSQLENFLIELSENNDDWFGMLGNQLIDLIGENFQVIMINNLKAKSYLKYEVPENVELGLKAKITVSEAISEMAEQYIKYLMYDLFDEDQINMISLSFKNIINKKLENEQEAKSKIFNNNLLKIDGIPVDVIKQLKEIKDLKELNFPESDYWQKVNNLVRDIFIKFKEQHPSVNINTKLNKQKILLSDNNMNFSGLLFFNISTIYKKHPLVKQEDWFGIKKDQSSQIFTWVIENICPEFKKKTIFAYDYTLIDPKINLEFINKLKESSTQKNCNWEKIDADIKYIVQKFHELNRNIKINSLLINKKILIRQGELQNSVTLFYSIASIYLNNSQLQKEQQDAYKKRHYSTILKWVIANKFPEYGEEKNLDYDYELIDEKINKQLLESLIKEANKDTCNWDMIASQIKYIMQKFRLINPKANINSNLDSKKILINAGEKQIAMRFFYYLTLIYKKNSYVMQQSWFDINKQQSSKILAWILKNIDSEFNEEKNLKHHYKLIDPRIDIQLINRLQQDSSEENCDWNKLNDDVKYIIQQFKNQKFKVKVKINTSLIDKKFLIGQGTEQKTIRLFYLITTFYENHPQIQKENWFDKNKKQPTQVFNWLLDNIFPEFKEEQNFDYKLIDEFINPTLINSLKEKAKKKDCNWDEIKLQIIYIIQKFKEKNPDVKIIPSLVENKILIGLGNNERSSLLFSSIASVYKYNPLLKKYLNEEDRDHPAKVFKWIIDNICPDINIDQDYTLNQIQEISKKNNFEDLLELFSNSYDLFGDYLNVFNERSLLICERKKLIRGFAKVNLGENYKPEWLKNSNKLSYWDRQSKLITALFQRKKIVDSFDNDKKNELISLIIKFAGKCFELDYEKEKSRLNQYLSDETIPTSLRTEIIKPVLDYYEKIYQSSNPEIKNIILYLFQKIGIKFLIDNDNCILADEQGLGKTIQAIAASEKILSLNPDLRVLIVCPKPLKNIWMEQINEYTNRETDEVFVLGENIHASLKKLKNNPKIKYIIINYEFLRNKTNEQLKTWFGDIEILIADEVQKADNPSDEVQQAAGLRKIKAQRKWFLSATPYFDKIEHLYTLLDMLEPNEWGTFEEFKALYTRDEDGLAMLGDALKRIMLRRTYVELGFDKDDDYKSLDVWVPKRNDIPIEENGRVELSNEQCDILLEMLLNFEEWAVKYNSKHSNKYKININNINPLSVLNWMIKVTYDARWGGGSEESPIINKIKEIISEKISKNEKILIFNVNTDFINQLAKWLEEKKIMYSRIDFKTFKIQTQERNKYINDPKCLVCLCNMQSASLGLTLPSNVIVYAQQPFVYSTKYQCDFRSIRLGIKKDKVDIINVVPVYTKYFFDRLNALEDNKLKNEIIENVKSGTLIEYLLSILKSKEIDFKLLMSGFGGIDSYNFNVKNELKKKIIIKNQNQLKVSGEFYSLWENCLTEAEQNNVEKLSTYFISKELKSKELIETILNIDNFDYADIEEIINIFEIESKWIRNKLIEKLPYIISESYANDITLVKLNSNFPYKNKESNHWKLVFSGFAEIWKNEDLKLPLIIEKILSKIENEQNDTKKRNAWETITELFVNAIGEEEGLLDFIEAHEQMLLISPIDFLTQIFKQLRFVESFDNDLYFNLLDNIYLSAKELADEINRAYMKIIFKSIGQDYKYIGELSNFNFEGYYPINEPFFGIGTSNKPIDKFVEEAKSNNVVCLVDVRSKPYSRFPQFNKDKFENSLKGQSIKYIYLGDILGGYPKNFTSFEEYMKTQKYKNAIDNLVNIINEYKQFGNVAVCCAEKENKDCHRRFIIDSLKERLGFTSFKQLTFFDCYNDKAIKVSD